jgi:hypothetical protein
MSDRTYPGRSPPGPTPFETTTIVSAGAHIHQRISWGAIFGGVILAVVLQLLMSTLGAGIGLGTVNVNAGTTPDAGNLGIGAGVWWVISSCIALLFGGYAAAWLAGIERRFDGVLHGLITWGLATLLTIYLLTSAIGGVIGGSFSALGSVTSAAGSGISDAARPLAQSAGVTPDVVQSQAQAFLQPSNPDPATMSPQDAQKEVAKNLVSYGKGGADAPAAKERIIAIMAAQMKISHDDAAKRFDDAQAKLQQSKDQAVQTGKNAADTTASAVSKSAFAAFAVLLLGALASAIGGSLAVQRRVQAAIHTAR